MTSSDTSPVLSSITTDWVWLIIPRFLDRTQRRSTVGTTHLDKWSARSRDLYLTTHNNHNRHTSMHPGGIRTQNPSRRAAVDLRLRPRGHWDRPRRTRIVCSTVVKFSDREMKTSFSNISDVVLRRVLFQRLGHSDDWFNYIRRTKGCNLAAFSCVSAHGR
jgi:hypothetical protein